jgi:metallophosphoesterase superfamily enzyme
MSGVDRLAVTDALAITADGAAWLPDARALVVADVHVGYARAARRRGGWLPTDAESPARLADRLGAACARTGATRLVIAGDLRHSTRDVDDAERAEVDELLARVRERVGRVDVVAGNHDRGTPYPSSLALGDVDIVHEPPSSPPVRWTVCGHLHPTTTLRDETAASLRVSCALVGERVVVLPAFTEWAGGIRAGRARRALGWGAWREVVTDGARAWMR